LKKFYPNYCAASCAETTVNDLQIIKELAGHEKVVAIGEVGLDYYHMRADKKTQKDVFIHQIKLAKKLKLPLIIHNRDSHDDIFEIITGQDVSSIGGVMHSFSGDEAFLEKILHTDLHVSFTGNLTFKKSNSEPLVKTTPLDRLLMETDSPFLTPVPLRGKRNEPAFIIHTAKRIAKIKDVTVEEIGTITSENARKLFNLSI